MVAVITGDEEDEGTMSTLARTNLTATANISDYVGAWLQSLSLVVVWVILTLAT